MIWGKTYQQRENARKKTEAWHRWFAWHPVQVSSGRWVWLRMVSRRSYLMRLFGTIDKLWEYK